MSFSAGQSEFLRNVIVSRETFGRLELYAAELTLWQNKVNLVASSTIPELWSRHFLDSAQLQPLMNGVGRLVDLGSGAGFPGLVLAILTGIETYLVESDQKKAVFLREIARKTEAPVTVHAVRAENLPSLAADVVTARALAPLADLLPMAYRHLKPGGRAVFLKGAGWQAEVETARQAGLMFHVKHFPSVTSGGAAVLEVGEITMEALR